MRNGHGRRNATPSRIVDRPEAQEPGAPMSIDLTGPIQNVIDGSLERAGRACAVGYIDQDGYPAVSHRGSTHVISPNQLALWTRQPNDGLAKGIAANPRVTVAFFDPAGDPLMLSMRGTARVDASRNAEVYAGIGAMEQGYDPEQGGVAVIIDVESVRGFGHEGPVVQG
ncbi:MAG: pyridoxamine 5'-phosphate oxidase family protein [Actinobacteria bacterium]|nr:pyridoxamine 5'-phosphate oxidase family protein [Actinomycetota bacterium]